MGNRQCSQVGISASAALVALAISPPALATILLKLQVLGGSAVVRWSGSTNPDSLFFQRSGEFYPAAFANAFIDIHSGLSGTPNISSDASANNTLIGKGGAASSSC